MEKNFIDKVIDIILKLDREEEKVVRVKRTPPLTSFLKNKHETYSIKNKRTN